MAVDSVRHANVVVLIVPLTRLLENFFCVCGYEPSIVLSVINAVPSRIAPIVLLEVMACLLVEHNPNRSLLCVGNAFGRGTVHKFGDFPTK